MSQGMTDPSFHLSHILQDVEGCSLCIDTSTHSHQDIIISQVVFCQLVNYN